MEEKEGGELSYRKHLARCLSALHRWGNAQRAEGTATASVELMALG